MEDSKSAVTIWDADGNKMKGVADLGDVVRSGYVGVEAGELSFSAEVSCHSRDIIRMLFGLSDEFNAQSVAFNRLLKTYNEFAEWMERFYSLARKGKCRKTTYRTIRRDCAKRNRRK